MPGKPEWGKPAATPLLTQAKVEGEILRLSNLLETCTDQLAEAMELSAVSASTWKCKEARSILASDKGSADQRKADALSSNNVDFIKAEVEEARVGALQEKVRTIRVQLDALRTLSASIRGQS